MDTIKLIGAPQTKKIDSFTVTAAPIPYAEYKAIQRAYLHEPIMGLIELTAVCVTGVEGADLVPQYVTKRMRGRVRKVIHPDVFDALPHDVQDEIALWMVEIHEFHEQEKKS